MIRVGYGVTVLGEGLQRGGVDGIGSVTREVLKRARRDQSIDLTPFEYRIHPSEAVSGSIPVGRYAAQGLWSLLSGRPFPVMQRALASKVDVVHATDHLIPRLRGIPVLATVMDAIPLSNPEWVSYRFRALKNEGWRRSAHWADHVVTISEFSRQEIARWFRLPEERISVIPLGVDEAWFEIQGAEILDRVSSTYSLPDHFFLFIGTLQPRKNLDCVLAAHKLLPREQRMQFPLVVVGRAGWECGPLIQRLQADGAAVRWLRYVPQDDLPAILRLATALVFPSLYEGFGLPVLEAFAAGTPVIASNTTSVPEVAGDAAMLLDPQDPSAWRDAMQALAGDDRLAQHYRARGLARARLFPWEATAAALADLYRRMV